MSLPLPEPFMELHRDLAPHIYAAWADQMHAYAAACVAAERERCAKLCERQAQLQIATGADDGVIAQAHRCAMVIRRV